MTQRMEPLLSNKNFRISGLSLSNARSRGLVGFGDTNISSPPRGEFGATSVSVLSANLSRHGGFQ